MAKLALLPPAVGEAFKTYVDVNFRRIEDFINNFIDTGVPTGTVIQAHRDDDLTPDYVEANGQAVSRADYPDLHALAQAKGYASGWGAGDGSTTFNVPNLNGRYIKQGVLGSTGGASSHQHANNCTSNGDHEHAHFVGSGGDHQHSHSVGSDGEHNHGGSTTGSSSINKQVVGTTTDTLVAFWTHDHGIGSSGTHQHTVTGYSAGDHNHTVTGNQTGDHNHTITNLSANNEPPWAAVKYYIKT